MAGFSEITRSLARAFVLGPMDETTLVRNASAMYFDGTIPRWLRPVGRHVAGEFSDAPSRPLADEVARSMLECPAYQRAREKRKLFLGSNRVPLPSEMLPGKGAPQRWKIPPATNLAELASLLEFHLDDLGWLASQNSKANHYHLRWHRKKSSPKSRLIEIPKPLLKNTQRIILEKILNAVPPHESSCGFQRGKSVIDFVDPHCGRDMVLKMDFRDFFPSISSGRIIRFFLTAGYPESVAGVLTDLCTNRIDPHFLDDSNLDRTTRVNLVKKHLPQGAPTSPALANLCSFRLDCRLSGLATAAGAGYTRYADDLLFSGGNDFRRCSESFHLKVLTIAIEEGFRINTRKTRFMHKGQRQQAGGLVMNRKTNLSRRDFDTLKAILANCVRDGWEPQNRDAHPDFRAHLKGRIEWASRANPDKAGKLRSLFERIDWEEGKG